MIVGRRGFSRPRPLVDGMNFSLVSFPKKKGNLYKVAVSSVLYYPRFVKLFFFVCWQVGADIVKRALSYPLKLIAKNAGVNGSVVSEKVYTITIQLYSFNRCFPHCGCIEVLTFLFVYQVLSSDNYKYGYNAATGQYEDLMAAGIIDPTKVSYRAHSIDDLVIYGPV